MPKAKSRKKVCKNASSPHPCTGATLDKLIQPAMLAILAKGPIHGYELARQVGEIPYFPDIPPDVSAIYYMLKVMESRGMVTSDWDDSQGRHRKRIFTITDTGWRALANWNATLRNYHQAIGLLIKITQEALS